MKFLLFLSCFIISTFLVNAEHYHFGVLDFQGNKVTMQRWQQLSTYLSSAIDKKVSVLALKNSPLTIRAKSFDFILTNPVATEMIADEFDYEIIATLNHSKQGPLYAGVIIVHEDSEISSLQDIAKKRVGVVNMDFAAGGYIFQAYELVKAGLEPAEDFKYFIELNNQIAIIKHVNNKNIDAGFIRTGMLEDIQEGLVDLDVSHLKMINQQNGIIDYPRSTSVYPHWGFLVSPSVPDKVKQVVKKALLELSPNHPSALAANIKGFVSAKDYSVIKQAINSLKTSNDIKE